MKRLSILILALLACFIISSCEGECEHTFNKEWSYDEGGHWHDSTCEHWVRSEEGEHRDENADFICDICSYVICAHTYNEEKWEGDRFTHWHPTTCSHPVPEDKKIPHGDFDSDLLCDICALPVKRLITSFDLVYENGEIIDTYDVIFMEIYDAFTLKIDGITPQENDDTISVMPSNDNVTAAYDKESGKITLKADKVGVCKLLVTSGLATRSIDIKVSLRSPATLNAAVVLYDRMLENPQNVTVGLKEKIIIRPSFGALEDSRILISGDTGCAEISEKDGFIELYFKESGEKTITLVSSANEAIKRSLNFTVCEPECELFLGENTVRVFDKENGITLSFFGKRGNYEITVPENCRLLKHGEEVKSPHTFKAEGGNSEFVLLTADGECATVTVSVRLVNLQGDNETTIIPH